MSFSTYRSVFKRVEGTILFDSSDPSASSVEAAADVASVVAEGEGLYGALVGDDFFQVQRHPKLTFRSTQVTPVGTNRLAVNGELTIRGVSRPVSLQVDILGQANHPFAQKPMTAFRASTEIDRGDWGIVWNAPLDTGARYLGERVKLSLYIEALHQA